MNACRIDDRIAEHVRTPTPEYCAEIRDNQAFVDERKARLSSDERSVWQHEAWRYLINACAEGAYIHAGVGAEDRARAAAGSLVARSVLRQRNGEIRQIREDELIVYFDADHPHVVGLRDGIAGALHRLLDVDVSKPPIRDSSMVQCAFRVDLPDVPKLPEFEAVVDSDKWLEAFRKLAFVACLVSLTLGSKRCFCTLHDLQWNGRFDEIAERFEYAAVTGLMRNYCCEEWIRNYDLDSVALPDRQRIAM